MFKIGYFGIFLLFYGCEGSYRAIIKKSLLYSVQCKVDKRKFMYEIKVRERIEKFEGKVSIAKGDTYLLMNGYKIRREIEASKDYFKLFGSGIFAIPEWVHIQILCADTDQIIFDSGKILRSEALCNQNGQLLFVIDSNKRKREKNNCCEPGLECPNN